MVLDAGIVRVAGVVADGLVTDMQGLVELLENRPHGLFKDGRISILEEVIYSIVW